MTKIVVECPDNYKECFAYADELNDRLQHKHVKTMVDFPSLFLSGECSYHVINSKPIIIADINILLPQLNLYVSILLGVCWLIWGGWWLALLTVLFVLPSVLWLDSFQEWMFYKGMVKRAKVKPVFLTRDDLVLIIKEKYGMGAE